MNEVHPHKELRFYWPRKQLWSPAESVCVCVCGPCGC